MNLHDIRLFQETVWQYYAQSGRHDLPWRLPEPDDTFDPYKVLVSEIMLQQTQVSRVVPKFLAFIAEFPTVTSLASAPLSAVLAQWNGLGYNRRAKFLWQAAQQIVSEHAGHVPTSQEALVRLPGVGHNTAGAVLAYSYNQPTVFIETNIRTVFIHHFFGDKDKVVDQDIANIVQLTLPPDEVRNWYWALMDYGTFLKQTAGNATRRSKSYVKQSRFEGSRRQIRGKVLRLLTKTELSKAQLVKEISDDRLDAVLRDLEQEGFIASSRNNYFSLR